MPDIIQLAREARRLSSDAFCARVVHPALVLDVADDEASFSTAVGLDTAPTLETAAVFSAQSVQLIEKSARNPYADRISVGRARSCDVIVRHPSVSKLHAHFLRIEGGWLALRDARSSNGTFVDGTRIEPDRIVRIEASAQLRFGSVSAQLLYPAALYDYLRRRPTLPP